MMRILTVAAIFLGTLQAQAESKKLGVGFVLGSPTALSVRHNTAPDHAFDAQIAFGVGSYLLAYADYLFLFQDAFDHPEPFIQQLVPYVGVGPLLAFSTDSKKDKGPYFERRSDSFALGVRVPVGIEWASSKFPIGVGIELAPGIVILPATTGFLQGGLTLRFYF